MVSLWICLLQREIVRADAAAMKMREACESWGTERPRNFNDPIEAAIIAARCEVAAGKFTGLEWQGLKFERRYAGDLEAEVEVKGTARRNGRLLIQKDCNPDRPFIHVRCHLHPWYELVGWAWGGECQRDEWIYRKGEEFCYLVPDKNLRRMSELMALISGRTSVLEKETNRKSGGVG